ncbi:MAG TPA: MarC family protein [Chthoniobacteraceae bacterium]|nr:MarC family protein [Chthoniobacteraceae bacterium]
MAGDVRFGLVAFTTLIVVVDPFGLLPTYLALTERHSPAQRRDVLRRAIVYGLLITLFFLVAGHAALAYLGVTVHAFAISGGILLFATAVPMLFGQRPATQGAETSEARGTDADIAIFPIAIPLLAGPGTITSVLLLAARANGDWARWVILAIVIAVVFLLAWLVLDRGSEWLPRKLGTSDIHVVTRVLGILLAALAVQFVLNGIAGYVHSLQGANLP